MSGAALPQSVPADELRGLARLGIIAGEGAFPMLIARAARGMSIPVTVFGIRGVTAPELEAEVDKLYWLHLGEIDKFIKLCHKDGVADAVLAGRIKHNSIFKLPRLDLRGMKILGRMANFKANSILQVVADELEREKIRVLDSTAFLRNLMPPAGLMTRGRKPDEEMQADIAFGYDLARKVAGLDIGQTVVVKSLSVVAVEAMEGTNDAIRRGGEMAGEGTVVVKVSKPGQDKRFDVPVAGLDTVRRMVEARVSVFAFTAGELLFFDQEESIRLADENGLIMIGV